MNVKTNDNPPTQLCFWENTRDTGTDLPNSMMRRTSTIDVEGCQRRCQSREGCNYFLYFTSNHPQWFKRRECRLFRTFFWKTFFEKLEINKEGHISGPKFCRPVGTKSDSTSFLKNEFNADKFTDFAYEKLTHDYNKLISTLCVSQFNLTNGKYTFMQYLNGKTNVSLK